MTTVLTPPRNGPVKPLLYLLVQPLGSQPWAAGGRGGTPLCCGRDVLTSPVLGAEVQGLPEAKGT